jgi:hypothetical protein
VAQIVRDIEASDVAEVALVVLNGTPADERNFWQKLADHRQSLLYLLYRKVDARLFSVERDAFAAVDLQPLLDHCPALTVLPRRTRFSDYLQADDALTIAGYELDVALRFGFRIIRGDFLTIARYGVWSYHHGDNLVNRGGPPGFWEVMEDEPVTGSVLQLLSERLDDGKVLYRSYSATQRHSVRRNKNSYYWKSAAFVLRVLRRLHEQGPAALEQDPFAGQFQPYSERLYTEPGNGEMARLLLGWAGRYGQARLRNTLYNYQWFLSYSLARSPKPHGATIQSSLYRCKPIMPPKDRFWADPFPLKRGDRFHIFIEEFIYSRGKGHISVLEMDGNGTWRSPQPVLERDYHLSYPFIFEWRGETWMIPESADNRTVELYRCVDFPGEWVLEKVLLEKVNAADATLVELDGMWWMFANIAVEGASKDDELHLFYAETPLGPWQPHPQNPLQSDARRARPAGRLFCHNGAWYRPAQDCSETYGYAISLNRITQLDRACYAEEETSKILPRWHKGMLATHTLNHAEELTVLDGLALRRKWL